MEENKKDFNDINEDFDEANIIVDEETGTEFEVLDSFDIDDKTYVVMTILNNRDEACKCDDCGCECDDDDHDEVYIYRLIQGEETDEFVAIEDDVELANAFEEFKFRNSELFDFEEEFEDDFEDDEEE